jgi:hypothetical protein
MDVQKLNPVHENHIAEKIKTAIFNYFSNSLISSIKSNKIICKLGMKTTTHINIINKLILVISEIISLNDF